VPILGAIVFFIQFCFAYHAFKTGRPYWWIFVIMGFPVMGCLIYYFVEVFPTTRESTKAAQALRKAVDGVSRSMDPEKELRQRIAELELNPSIDSKLALAAECVASNMQQEAVKLYRACLTGPYAGDPHIKLALANAELAANEPAGAKATAHDLLVNHAGYKTGEAALVLARALERLGEVNAAEAAFADAIGKFSGEEARFRYGAMLRALGQPERARMQFADIIKNSDRAPEFYRESQAEWIKAARSELESKA
jgi:hypothetical protein